jgi:aerobic-type carbon monoxide dehydrogenase small subunit (CoxS/CutS family)
MLAMQARGRSVRTIEGLGQMGVLTDLQNSFVNKGVPQCGFCIPGVLMAARLLAENPHPRKKRLLRHCGNLCRCTGTRPWWPRSPR